MVTKGDRRRQQILDTVAELLESSTYDDISITEITRRADVTRPGFYFYFPTKGAAVASLMEGLFADYMDAAAVWYEHRETDQRDGIRIGMAATVDLWRKHAVVMHGMVQAAATDREAEALWNQWVGAFTARALPTVSADTREAARAERVTTFLVDATFAAMQRDVRSIVETGEGTPDLLETIVQVWVRTLYGG